MDQLMCTGIGRGEHGGDERLRFAGNLMTVEVGNYLVDNEIGRGIPTSGSPEPLSCQTLATSSVLILFPRQGNPGPGIDEDHRHNFS